MAVTLRAIGLCDPAVLSALHALSFPEEPWSAESFASLLAMPGACGSIALEEGEPLGYILCRTAVDQGEIISLGVVPAARRRGVGRLLLDAVLDDVRKDGVDTMFLEVAEDNAAGRALYAAAGFVPISRRPGYYIRPDGRVTALVLRATLTA